MSCVSNFPINHKTVISFDVSHVSNIEGTFAKLSILLDFDVYEFNIQTGSHSACCSYGTWYTTTPNIDHVYQEEILDYNYWLGETITNIRISEYEDSEKFEISIDFTNNDEILFSIVFYQDGGCGGYFAFPLIITRVDDLQSSIIYEGNV
jgi:hypothetical protein